MEDIIFYKKKLYSKQDFTTLQDRFVQSFEFIFPRITIETLLTSLIQIKISLDFDLIDAFKYELSKFNIPTFTYEDFEPETYEKMKYKKYEKGIYGKSRYGWAYYDPLAVRRAVANILFRLGKQSGSHVSATTESYAVEGAGLIIHAITRGEIARLPLIAKLIQEAPFCGFFIVGKTPIVQCKQVDGIYYYETEITTARFIKVPIKVSNIFELSHGFIVGITPVGFSRAVGARTLKTNRLFRNTVIYKIIENARGQLERFLRNITGLKLPRATVYYRTDWVEKYGEHVMMYRIVEENVKKFLSRLKIDVMKVNLYCDFVRELIFGRLGRHRIGKRGFMYIDEKYFINYLIAKYEKLGLDRRIMERLIQMYLPYARQVWRRLSSPY